MLSFFQILDNAEINNLIKILGLQYNKKYSSADDLKSLRYGHVMIMTDQDQDGSHIKGLLINFIHSNWPSLTRMSFLEEFITPIVKVRNDNVKLNSLSMDDVRTGAIKDCREPHKNLNWQWSARINRASNCKCDDWSSHTSTWQGKLLWPPSRLIEKSTLTHNLII